ncbi:hypothetical protein [Streptomyces sp. NBC_00091]|uniref:hypothetical protein n=1 Tax=Streptomyces sp. NBC_00091 TaxID=2975648 RepID=UPI00225058D3|nr:hypothetical protein [Streptomyces sp. NBC_00091]MCX5376129.1 hypothetical protein [Streptomyces sp. NBC_00091]
MSNKITAQTEQLGRTPRITAGLIAQNAVPDVQEALKLMGVAGAAYAAGVNELDDGGFDGLVHISLSSADAYDFARWIVARAPATSALEVPRPEGRRIA